MFRSTNRAGLAAHARALVGLFVGVSLLTTSALSAKSSTVSYPDFSSVNGLTLNGYYGPQQVGTALRLVQAAYSQRGGAWTTGKVYVKEGFNTTFTFQLSNEVGPNGHGADGFTFDIQNEGNTITTGEGGTASDPNNAVTVSIRDFQNGVPGDVSDNVIKIFGNNQNLVAYLDLYSLNINVHDDQPHTIHVAYDGSNMSLTIDGKTAPAITNVAVPLGSAMDANGFAYAGFGGRTGGYYQNVDILSWTLTSPSAIAGLGLGGAFTDADFSSDSNLQLVGDAQQSGNLIQLTQAQNGQSSGAWHNLREPVAKGFDTTFQFQLTNENGGADGFAFNVTTDGFVTGGENGTGGSSIAVGIDTYQNSGHGDPSSNFVKLVDSTGTVTITQDLGTLGIDTHDDLPHTVVVHYDGANISVTIDSTAIFTNVALPLGSAALADGTAVVGFTGRTGGLNEEIDLLSWTFSPAGATVTGNIALEGVPNLAAIAPAAPLGVFDIQFRTPGTSTIILENKNVTLTASAGSAKGAYSVSGVAAGTYDVWIKGSKNLAVLVPGVTVTATGGTVANVILPAADGNNDNSVDTSDFGVLVGGYNGDSTIPGSGYDPNADFNFDGVVDTSDFSLLVGQYNNVGAN